MALPGDDGRDDDLGALGHHAPGRLDQPRRDDVVQPLRPRRGGRLAAPDGRGPRAGGAGLPDAAGRPAARPRHHLGLGHARDAVRHGRGVVDVLGGTAFSLEVTVPPNTTAEVSLPDGSAPLVLGFLVGAVVSPPELSRGPPPPLGGCEHVHQPRRPRSPDCVPRFPGADGEPVTVEVYSADEVELLLDGTSLGIAPAGEKNRFAGRVRGDLRAW